MLKLFLVFEPNHLIIFTRYSNILKNKLSVGCMQDFSKLSSTKGVPVPKLLLEQIVGQEKAVEIIKKAAIQR